jgi:Helix-turn-helix domain of resolvase
VITVLQKRGERVAKKGRPFVYQSDTEKPVTVSVRLPRDLHDQIQRYVKRHPGMTLTEFFLDGARLRLDTPADPRDILLSDDNTVIQEVQEMIRAAVQAEIGKLSDFLGPRFSPPGDMPAPEPPPPPVAELSYNGNAVIQEEAPRRSTRRGGLKLTPEQEVALRVKRQQGTSIQALMKEYGISRATVFRYLE